MNKANLCTVAVAVVVCCLLAQLSF